MHKIYLRRKALLKPVLLLVFFMSFANAYSQASLYGFSQQQGTYTPLENPTFIVAPTALTGTGSVDDQKYELTAGTIPFPFSFAGQEQTGLWVYANGFITFGPNAQSGSSPLSNTTTIVQGAISALGADLHAIYNLNGMTGDISYEVVGDAPNREFVIQWTHFRPYSSSTNVNNLFDWSFQIRLGEDNNIAMVYDLKVTGTPTSASAQVGLRGALATDYNTRYSITTWMASATGGGNTSSISTNSTSLPPTGFTFDWAAPAACIAPTAQPTAFNATVNGIIVTGSFTAASPAADKYLVLRTPQGTSPNAPVDGTTYAPGNSTALNANVSLFGTATAFTDNATSNIVGNTNYTYTIYSVNTACTGGPLYNLTDALEADVTTCPGPINTFSANNVTTTAFDITWTPNNGTALPLTYAIEVSTASDFAAQVAGSPFTVEGTETTFNVSGLQSATKYYYRIKAVTSCGASVVSSSKNVTTLCVPAAEIAENFNTTANTELPGCWTRITRGTGTSTATVGVSLTNGVNSSPAISIYNSGANNTTAGVDVIAVSPQLTNLNAGTYRLRFKAKKSATGTFDIQVGTLNNNSATGVFTPLGAVTTLTTDFIEYTVYFADYTGTDAYIGFRKTGTSTYTNVYIDDVVWEAVPSCLTPVSLAVSNVTHESADFAWNFDSHGGAPAGGYEYAIATTATLPADAVITQTDGLTASFDELLTGTTYYAFVRSVCGDEDKSAWSTIGFSTKLVKPAPWTEGFATVSTIPAGWVTTGWTINSENGVPGNPGTNIFKNLYSSATTGNFTTVNVGPLPANSELSFDYRQSNYNAPYAPLATWGNFKVQVSTDFGANWTDLATVANEAGTGSYINKVYSLAGYENDIVSIKIIGTRTAGDFNLSFDNFKIATGTMGIGDFLQKGFAVYPNPATDLLNITSESEVKLAQLYNITGQLVGTFTSNTINVSGLPAGAYILNIELENGITGSQKIIKQ